MHQDSKRTCTPIVLFIKPFVWCRSRHPRRRGLLKLPIVRWKTGHAFYVIGLKNIRIHSSTQGSSALKCLQSMRRSERVAGNLLRSPNTCFQVNHTIDLLGNFSNDDGGEDTLWKTILYFTFECRNFSFFKIPKIWSFHVVVLEKTAKKCTKIQNARAQSLFCSLNLLFGVAIVTVAVVVC